MQRIVDFQSGEKLVQKIKLLDITSTHNPRNPARSLQLGMEKEGHKGSFIQFAQLGLSEKQEDRQEYCRMIETYEIEPDGIFFLAVSRNGAEVQPILLRDFRVKLDDGSYATRYGLIAGERRYLAAVYNYAKYGTNDTIGGVVKKMTVDDAEKLAFAENIFRRNPHPLEIGEFLHAQMKKINPATEHPWKLAELAREFGLEYQFAMTRSSLVYLSDEDKRKLLSGKLGLTNAVKKGMALRKGEIIEVPDKKKTHHRALPIASIRNLFDNTYDGEAKDPQIVLGYRMALSAVMGLTLQEAEAESQKRQEEQELQEALEVENKSKD